LGDPDKSSEIEEPEDFNNISGSDDISFPQQEDDLSAILSKGMDNVGEFDKQEAETKDMPEPEADIEQETYQNMDELTSSISPAQIEASLERVINKIFSEKIEKILARVVEKAVAEEISKFRASFMENMTDEDSF